MIANQRPFLFTLLMLVAFAPHHVFSKSKTNRFHVEIPTAQQEADSVWRTIIDISFFEQHGYSVNLPVHPLVGSLLEKSRNNQLSDQDYAKLQQVFTDQIYKPDQYTKSVAVVKSVLPKANKALNSILKMDLKWPFKSFDRYDIQLTLYGSGGSYRPETGAIILFTNPQGGFKNYKDPINTIVHETVHIGIEDSIVQDLNLTHAMKEQAVDVFVKVAFPKELPEYRIQQMGTKNLTDVVDSIDDLANFKVIIADFLK